MNAANIPREFEVSYQGQPVRVRVDGNGDGKQFLVFLPGEDGHLVLTVGTDNDGNESWHENGEATVRAAEIGEMIEDSAD